MKINIRNLHSKVKYIKIIL